MQENEEFASPFDLEEERRKVEASEILYRAIKYVIGYLKGYRIEKNQNLTSNPMWIFIKVWWKKEDVEMEIEKIEEEIRRMERGNWEKTYGESIEEEEVKNIEEN